MRLGTVTWSEGPAERRALVAPLPSDPGRVVDLNRVEQVRLRKLGEGQFEALAAATVPPSLRQVLEAGPRAIQRLRQTLAYAEKWARRGGLPASLAPALAQVRTLPCLPRPALVRMAEGRQLDRLAVQGPGARIGDLPHPTLAVVGLHGGAPAGFCIALPTEGGGAILGGWLWVGDLEEGTLELRAAGQSRVVDFSVWEHLEATPLRAGEVLLLPTPRLRALQRLQPGEEVEVRTPFETLLLEAGPDQPHPTLQ